MTVAVSRSGDMLNKTHWDDDGFESFLEWVCELFHVNIKVTNNVNIICYDYKVRKEFRELNEERCMSQEACKQ